LTGELITLQTCSMVYDSDMSPNEVNMKGKAFIGCCIKATMLSKLLWECWSVCYTDSSNWPQNYVNTIRAPETRKKGVQGVRDRVGR